MYEFFQNMRGSVELHERLIIFQTGRDSQPRNQSLKPYLVVDNTVQECTI